MVGKPRRTKRITVTCALEGCSNTFEKYVTLPQKHCSRICAAKRLNKKRVAKSKLSLSYTNEEKQEEEQARIDLVIEKNRLSKDFEDFQELDLNSYLDYLKG